MRVLPGTYLSREADGVHPGQHYIRIALVAPIDTCHTALAHIRNLFETLT